MKRILTALLAASLFFLLALPAFAAVDSVSVSMDGLQYNKYGENNTIKATGDAKTKEIYFQVNTLPYIVKNNKTINIDMYDGTLTIPASAWNTPEYQQATANGRSVAATLTVEFQALNDETTLFKYTTADGMVRADKSSLRVELLLSSSGKHYEVETFATPVTFSLDYDFTPKGTMLTADDVAFYWIDEETARSTGNYEWTYLPGTRSVDKLQYSYTFQTDHAKGVFIGAASKNHQGAETGDANNGSNTGDNSSGGQGSISGHWAESAIVAMQELGIVPETASSFYPNREITRGEFAYYLVRTLGLEENLSGLGRFTDVPTTYDYYREVYTAAAAGIVKGDSDTTFSPNAAISRQEMAVMMNRAWVYAGKTANTDQTALRAYKDQQQVASWAVEGVASMINSGLITGRAENAFAPMGTTTRAEAIVILYRLQQSL